MAGSDARTPNRLAQGSKMLYTTPIRCIRTVCVGSPRLLAGPASGRPGAESGLYRMRSLLGWLPLKSICRRANLLSDQICMWKAIRPHTDVSRRWNSGASDYVAGRLLMDNTAKHRLVRDG